MRAGGGGEEGEEESYFDPAWVHLQLVYEFFLRFIVSSEVRFGGGRDGHTS